MDLYTLAQEEFGNTPSLEYELVDIIALVQDSGGNYTIKQWIVRIMNSDYVLPVGDVNFDGTVNVLDVVLMVNYILNSGGFNDAQFEAGDFNSDDTINVLDVVQITNLIMELNT